MGKNKFLKFIDQFNPYYHLKARLILTFGLSTIILSILLLVTVSVTTEKALRKNVGFSLGQLAIQTADKLDRGLFERKRDINVATTLPIFRDLNVTEHDKRIFLEKLQSTYDSYAWIGFVDMNGFVISSTGGLLEGINVTAREWYQQARKHGQFIGDVHPAKLLASLLTNPYSEALRFLDVAATVRDYDNNTIGVLGAHLYWNYFREVEDSILTDRLAQGSTLSSKNVEMFLLNEESYVLAGPIDSPFYNQTTPKLLDMPEIQKLADSGEYYTTTKFPGDEVSYLIGVAKCIGYRDYYGLGWTVVLRQDESIAFRPLRDIQLQIGLIGGGLALLFSIFGWIMASRIVGPILRIVRSADRIMQLMPTAPEQTQTDYGVESSESTDGITRSASSVVMDVIDINSKKYKPNPRGSMDDVGILFESLRGLVRSLDKEQSLKVMNGQLETRVRERTMELLNANKQLENETQEKNIIQGILSNMMPDSIQARIKNGEQVIADYLDGLTIFFSDIVGFTNLSGAISAQEVVHFLNQIFMMMDELSEKYKIEKIKTIGDAYFAVGGLFPASEDEVEPGNKPSRKKLEVLYAAKVLEFALEVLKALDKFNRDTNNIYDLKFRIGVSSGPAIAGIIGTNKPFFDLWGDTINTASRMESHGSPGRVHVSQTTYDLTKHLFEFETRGEIKVKGKGSMTTYWLIGRKRHLTSSLSFTNSSSFNLKL